MDPLTQHIVQSRREFLATAASGVGGLALAQLLASDNALASPSGKVINPLSAKPPHFKPKAKACIFIFMAGAPSQLDLFDPKPKLREMDGQPLPDSMTEKVRFAFIQKESAVLMGSKSTFERYGECGMELSNLLPHIGSCADDVESPTQSMPRQPLEPL